MFLEKQNKKIRAFTLAEVLIAKRERGKMSLLNLSRTRELKVPSSRFLKPCAFTLAEVLITLGIIGVVAALTIPTLVNNYQKTQYITGLKKAYTQFNQVILQITSDYGCSSDLVCTGFFSSPNTTIEPFADEVAQRFKLLKNCELTTDTGCWPTTFNANFDGSSGTNYNWDVSTRYRFITTDGFSFIVSSFTTDCNTPTFSNGVTGNMTQVCGRVLVDVNGQKGPNYYGRDIFSFWLTNGKGAILYPGSGADDKYNGTNYWWNSFTPPVCSNNTGRQMGNYCTGRVMEENWQMNY